MQEPITTISKTDSISNQSAAKTSGRIQNDIQKIRTTSGPSPTTRAKSKKLASSRANIKPRSKKSKSLKSAKLEEIERVGDKIKKEQNTKG